jgi:mRNA (guanine-N7-)-methyltransferase
MEKIRRLNNGFKIDLINDAYSEIPYAFETSQSTSALDLACGRGGDLLKFYHANYQNIVMVDRCDQSIDHAKNRLSKLRDPVKIHVSFYCKNLIIEKFHCHHFVDTVFINFALNQMLKDDDSIDCILSNCSVSLKEGGIFTGIALDGERVRNLIDSRDFDTDFLTLQYSKDGGYSFCIKQDNDETYFENSLLCHEYFLDFHPFVEKAKLYGFTLISWYHPYNHQHEEDTASKILNLNVIFKFRMTNSVLNMDLCAKKFDSSIYFPVLPSRSLKPLLLLTKEGRFSSSRKFGSQRLVRILQRVDNLSNFLDACACCGTDSFFVARNLPNLNIVAIEKDEENSTALVHNSEVLDLPNLVIYPFTDVIEFLDKNEQFFDVIYFDLPWGGTEYKSKEEIRLFINGDVQINDIIDKYKDVKCKHLIFKVPLNFDMKIFQPYRYQTFSFVHKNVLKFNFIFL